MAVFFIAGNTFAFDMKQIQIHGFVSQGFLKSDENDFFFANTEKGTFEFNELGLNFTSQLTDQLRLGIQFLSRDLGDYGNNDVEIDWAYGDYRYRNWLGIQAGRMKIVQGFYNQSRDIDAARTCIFLPSAYNEAYRDSQSHVTGISLYGTLPAGFEYQFQYGKLNIEEDGAAVKAAERAMGLKSEGVEVDSDSCIFHMLWNTPLEGLRFAGNYLWNFSWSLSTPIGEIDNDSDIWFLSAMYSWRNFSFVAEGGQANSKVSMGDMTLADSTAETYYGMITYRFTDWLEVGSYYGELYPNKDDKDGDNFLKHNQPAAKAWLKDFAVFSRFDITDNWIFKIEAHYMDGLATVTYSSSDVNPSEEAFLFAAKATFTF